MFIVYLIQIEEYHVSNKHHTVMIYYYIGNGYKLQF